MLQFIASALGSLFTNLTLGLIFSALIVGGVFYAYSLDLPSTESLAQYAPETISRVYDSEGQVIAEFAVERRIFVPIQDIPPIVQQAFVSAEDKHFYTHHGYDVEGMISALVTAIRTRGKVARGASTITQQVVKNLQLSGERSIERKVKEIILATRLEAALCKDKILELYLNEIFLGHNSFGVAAAARTYFNKTLDQLTVAEAATLAAHAQGAVAVRPGARKDGFMARRAYVLGQMRDNGYIDEATLHQGDGRADEIGAGRRFFALSRIPAAARLFHRRPPPAALRHFRPERVRRRRADRPRHRGARMQKMAAKSLQDGLEKYDRAQGIWRGTGRVLPAKDLKGDAWRPALAGLQHLPRDVAGWHAAVVLGLSSKHAKVGIEGRRDERRHRRYPGLGHDLGAKGACERQDRAPRRACPPTSSTWATW